MRKTNPFDHNNPTNSKLSANKDQRKKSTKNFENMIDKNKKIDMK